MRIIPGRLELQTQKIVLWLANTLSCDILYFRVLAARGSDLQLGRCQPRSLVVVQGRQALIAFDW